MKLHKKLVHKSLLIIPANKIGYKILKHEIKIPYMAIIGEKEMQDGTVSLRSRDEGDIGALSVEDLVGRIQEEMKPRL